MPVIITPAIRVITPHQASLDSGWGPRCNPFMFRLGACPRKRGAAGTTAQQVKQSFFGALAILTTAIPVGDVLDAFLGTRAAQVAAEDLPGYSSFRAAKADLGSPGAGNVYDHVVEQSQVARSGFTPEEIHNPFNLDPVPRGINQLKPTTTPASGPSPAG